MIFHGYRPFLSGICVLNVCFIVLFIPFSIYLFVRVFLSIWQTSHQNPIKNTHPNRILLLIVLVFIFSVWVLFSSSLSINGKKHSFCCVIHSQRYIYITITNSSCIWPEDEIRRKIKWIKWNATVKFAIVKQTIHLVGALNKHLPNYKSIWKCPSLRMSDEYTI